MRRRLLTPGRLLAEARRGATWEGTFKHGYIWPDLGDRKPTHIIVGAGSAGCVLANRLTEDPSNRVLLLEAGPQDHRWDFRLHMPAALMYNLCHHTYNWFYHTQAQKNLDDRVIYWPRGRVWGGSSSLNAMCYVRGHPLDYDRWEEEGADGWSFKNCLPYFKRAESYNKSTGSNDIFRGDKGPLRVRRGACENPLHQAWLQVGKQHPLGFTEDMNGYKQEGIGTMDLTINDDGTRCSASRAYLWPILSRPNLHVSSGVTCTKVLFDKNKAIGVELIMRQKYYGTQHIDSYNREKIYCEDSVILAGGAINTPQLLLLSGVGPLKHLRAQGIEAVCELNGVGSNLQDHLEVYIQQKCKKPVTLYGASSWKYPHRMIKIGLEWLTKGTGLGSSSHLESGGFARSRPEVPNPDIQFHFLPGTVHDDGRTVGTCHAYQVHVGSMRSKSTGSIRLASSDPRREPLIDPKYMSREEDWEEFRAAIRLSRELFASKAFDEFRGEELAPGDDKVNDDQLDAFVRKTAASAYHPSCTCKMGRISQEGSVVDPLTMGVHGTEDLKVVDASVMPSIVSGNLNAAVIMIAEKAADIIMRKEPLPAENPEIYVSQASK